MAPIDPVIAQLITDVASIKAKVDVGVWIFGTGILANVIGFGATMFDNHKRAKAFEKFLRGEK